MDAEKFFDFDSSIEREKNKIVQRIKSTNILSDAESFESISSQGYNPRKFLAFNESNLELLVHKLKTKEADSLLEKFSITKINGSNLIDTSQKSNSENLIKLLCGKAMLNPFNNDPMEVTSSKKWS